MFPKAFPMCCRTPACSVLTPVATSVSRDNVPTSGTPPRAPRSKLVNTPLVRTGPLQHCLLLPPYLW